MDPLKTSRRLVYWSPKRVGKTRLLGEDPVRRRRVLREAARLLILCFCFSVFHVWTRVQVLRSGYDVRGLLQAQEQLKGENHTLRLEVATLRSPLRLERVAKELGLKNPPENQVTFLSERSP